MGRHAEQLVAMAFVLHGCDVYRGEVDDRGVDLVVRRGDSPFVEVQVKSIRKGSYVFFRKDRLALTDTSWAAVVRFHDGRAPDLYLPSRTWEDPRPPFFSRDFLGKKSKPEWGLAFKETRSLVGAISVRRSRRRDVRLRTLTVARAGAD